MPTTYDSIDLKTLFEYHDQRKLLLPNFQRDFVWKPEQQVNLLASILVNIPVGAILILEGSKGSFGYRELSISAPSHVEPKEPIWYLLDGQQRMSTLHSILSDHFQSLDMWEQSWDNLYSRLRFRWFIRIKPRDGEEDLFGYNELYFVNHLEGRDPDEVKDFIEPKRILKTKTDQWHHPAHMTASGRTFSVANEAANGMHDVPFEELSPDRQRLETAKLYANKGVVPLFDVWKGKDRSEQPLYQTTLHEIAKDRAAALKADVGNDSKALVRLLERTDPSIRDYVVNKAADDIDNAWMQLSTNWARSVGEFLKSILHIKIPFIKLPENEVGRGIAIFEHMNTGGTTLDTFDLIVARATASDDFEGSESLSQRVAAKLKEEIELPKSLTHGVDAPDSEIPDTWSCIGMGTVEDDSPDRRVRDEYLSFLSILAHTNYGRVNQITGDHTRSKMIMKLTADKINQRSDDAVKALVRALAFLQFRCGIVSVKDIPYKRMILPLGYLFYDDANWNNASAHNKAEFWYWTSILGGAYRYDKNQVSIQDIKDLHQWVDGSENPFVERRNKLFDEKGYSDPDVLVGCKDERGLYVTAPKPVVNTILHYVLSRSPKDLLPKSEGEFRLNAWDVALEKRYENEQGKSYTISLEDHHIYPLAQATSLGESSKEIRKKSRTKNGHHPLNSVLNRTYISDRANRMISSRSPDRYLSDVHEAAIRNHLVPTPFSEAYDKLEGDAYEEVLRRRFEKIRDALIQELDRLKDS